MASNNTRFLIIPDIEIDGDHIVSVTNSSGEREEAGRSIRQPTAPSSGSLPGGDIRLTLSGEPDSHAEGLVHVSRSGPVDHMRYGWMADDTTEGLQFRQSCAVVGRRPDVLIRDLVLYQVRPKALSLANGKLLVWWIAITEKPLHQVTLPVGDAGDTYQGTWSTDGTWAVTQLTVPERNYVIPSQFMGVDAVQFPDTEEIVLMHVVTEEYDTVLDAYRQIYVHVSQDSGATWEKRGELICYGSTPDLTIEHEGGADGTAFSCCAAEILDNGRIVLAFATRQAAYSIVSDDRGVTWSKTAVVIAGTVTNDGTEVTVVNTSLSIAKARNGTLMCTFAYPNVDTAAPPARPATADATFASLDGESWEGGIGIVESSETAGYHFAIMVRPDGWPQIYHQMHQYDAGTLNEKTDWMLNRTMAIRDPNLDVTSAVWFPPFSSDLTSVFPMHGVELDAGAGDLGATIPEAVYQGFGGGIEAITHRGETWIFSCNMRETGSTNPVIQQSTLMCYRLSHWQPLQERLGYGENTVWPFSGNSSGRLYNFTWDPYDLPWAGGMYTLTTTGGTSTLSDASTDGVNAGYMEISTAAQTLYYNDTGLPNPEGVDELGVFNSSISGVVRFFIKPVSGGSLTTNDVALRLVLNDSVNEHGIVIRFDVSGADVDVRVLDFVGGATLADDTFTTGEWLEVVASLHEEGSAGTTSVYIRELTYSTDPDLTVEYTAVVDEGATVYQAGGTNGDMLQWGHIASNTAVSWWKGVYLSRVDKAPASTTTSGIIPLETFDETYVDENNYVILFDDPHTAFGLNDSGVFNNMRTSQATAVPSQWVSRGAIGTWRGETQLTGNYDFEVGYDYGQDNLLDGPVAQEWRSSEDVAGLSDDIEILIDGGSNLQYKPTGLAVFGRNWNTMRIQMNDTDSWGAPRVDVLYSTPNDPLSGSADRMTHMWSNDAALFTSTVSGRQLVCINTVTANGPWRAHQFRSQETGPWYYLMLIDTGGSDASNRKIYKILDNDEGKLTLDGDPGADGFSSGVNFDIFSDRFAVELGPRHSVLDTAYRYIKITIYGVNHRDDDEQFQRVGRFVLGYAHDMSGPMFDWGWSRNESSGSSLATGTNGVRYATRNHSPRRQFQARYRMLRAPLEADEVTGSPLTSWRSPGDSWFFGGGGSPKTWGHVVDILRRLEMDGRRAALVWDGDRAVDIGSTSAVVQTAADPMELLMVRVTNVGNMQHIGYEGQDKNLAGGTECKPTPMMQQTYTFEEDF